MEEKEREWIYKTTAKKEYKLTDFQIQQAVETGLVQCKYRRNPYYSSAPQSLLLKKEDIDKNIDKIKELERYSEEDKKRMKYYRDRKKKRDEISFFCPRCQKKIRALRGSYIFEEYYAGRMSKEEAIEILKLLHYRHVHTEYDETEDEEFLSKEEKEEMEEWYREYRDAWDRDMKEWCLENLRAIRSIGHDRKKEHFNKIAKELIAEDFKKG